MKTLKQQVEEAMNQINKNEAVTIDVYDSRYVFYKDNIFFDDYHIVQKTLEGDVIHTDENISEKEMKEIMMDVLKS